MWEEWWHVAAMTRLLGVCFAFAGMLVLPLGGTTISVVPIFEPLSLHGTDVDGDITESGEALQAAVCSRPMALTGAFPEDLVNAINSPHKLPSNNPNYQVPEANLLALCGVKLAADVTAQRLAITIDIAALEIPEEVDLTARQLLKLTLVAIRKTLEAYQGGQTAALKVAVKITGASEGQMALKDLATEYELAGKEE